jgi:signal transduction histidine kinase
MAVKEKVNVLAVDDNQANLLALEKILKNPDLNLVKSISGNEALACLLENEFACIILDVTMPEMDGFELAQIIRNDERTKYIPIIFASGNQRTEADIFKGYETGAVDYLLKPLDATIVRSKVNVFAELYRHELALKRAKTLLAEYAKDLQRSNEELDQFAHIAAHDLQAPIRAIAGYAEMLTEDCMEQLGDTGKEWLQRITERTARMHSLIQDLLVYSKAGRKQPSVSFDVSKTVVEVTQDLSQHIKESGAKIILGNLPTLVASPLELRQLMQNLIGNAIKYQKKDTPPEVHVSAEKADGNWRFKISDNGIGIQTEHMNKLFVIFSRLHTSNEYQGTGIGLAICKKIVARHHGKIWVESEPGKGSAFYFTLPADELPDSGQI